MLFEFPIYLGDKVGEAVPYLHTRVTNIGKATRLIERPDLELNRADKDKKIVYFIDYDETANFPREVKPSHVFDHKVKLDKLKQGLRELDISQASKIRVVLKDTNGKRYCSNWIPINKIT